MSPARYDLGDYKEVSERIIDFRQKYPDGSLKTEVILWPTKELPFLAVKAQAFRSRKDENPGEGHAWEPFPGKTPYTRDSELQNAETSAWGRAIVAALASDTRQGIASADEVRNRRSPDPSTQASTSRGGSGDETGSTTPPVGPVSPSTTASGTAHPEGSAAGAEANNRGSAVEAPAAVTTKCGHTEWVPAPNPDAAAKGIMVCARCGKAEKRAA